MGLDDWHDRVDQITLAKHQLTMDAWLYPTDFLETYCITAVEMQLAEFRRIARTWVA